jgi:mannan endo-1,4-beta-mannosidase
MIDASLWGQNVDQLLRVGPALLKHDPLGNVIFSTHSYWAHEQATDNYYKVAKKSKELGIAMIVGEGPSVTRVGQCDNPSPLPYLEGMKILQEHQIGWLNWSWGGMKNGDCDNFRYFDITKEGIFGQWWHQPGANIVALSPYSVMQTSHRPKSFFHDGNVKLSGIYINLEKTLLNRNEKTQFTVITAPANATNKKYTLGIDGNNGVIKLNEQSGQITALKSGKATITAKADDSGISWTTEIIVN